MFRTISIGTHALAQGRFVRSTDDGQIEIDLGDRRLSGEPVAPGPARDGARLPLHFAFTAAHWKGGLLSALAAIGLAFAAAPVARAQEQVAILNVSYDPTREFYRAYNELFGEWWTAQGNAPVTIQQSHGGAGAQARAVIDGLEATLVTLALSADIDKIAALTGKIPGDWQSRLPHNSSPYTSTIVFLVREGNPKGIKDWDDLVAGGVQVITPNPKTSGGARWNFLAAWGYAQRNNLDPREFVGELYRHVPVLDTGARGSTNTFTQRGIGDVLLAWENEAFLALKEQGEDAFDIVVPSVSMLAEPPVALVDGNISSQAQRAVATAYLEHLYSPEAQALALKHFYRAWDISAADPADVARFPEITRVSVDEFGGWPKVQPEFFGEGGVFDQIYEE
ncbi:MAG: sulfate ABC transporter substrate-binding protein [Alphaproteobacteria bacterium]|nr:sulfate ABC transporter substrate-binding protein [Alphaproteobacteria bacterium]